MSEKPRRKKRVKKQPLRITVVSDPAPAGELTPEALLRINAFYDWIEARGRARLAELGDAALMEAQEV